MKYLRRLCTATLSQQLSAVSTAGIKMALSVPTTSLQRLQEYKPWGRGTVSQSDERFLHILIQRLLKKKWKEKKRLSRGVL